MAMVIRLGATGDWLALAELLLSADEPGPPSAQPEVISSAKSRAFRSSRGRPLFLRLKAQAVSAVPLLRTPLKAIDQSHQSVRHRDQRTGIGRWRPFGRRAIG